MMARERVNDEGGKLLGELFGGRRCLEITEVRFEPSVAWRALAGETLAGRCKK